MCLFEGLRLKRTGLLANHDIRTLLSTCDQSHEHQPWIDSANFRTSDEAAYPLNFCRQIALRVSALAEAADIQITLPSCGEPWREVRHLMMASVGTQSSGNRLNHLPPSYHERWVSQGKLSACALGSGFPPGAKLPPQPAHCRRPIPNSGPLHPR